MITLPRLVPVFALLGLGACLSGPGLEVATQGRLPVGTTQSFAMDQPEDAPSQAGAASNAVARALSARGWLPGGAPAQWRIEALYAERPGSLGAFLAEAAPAEPGEWRIRPTPRRWWRRDRPVAVLKVRIVDTATGNEIVRAEAKQRMDGPLASADLDQLATAVVAEALADDRDSTALR